MDWWRKRFIICSGFVEALIFSGCLFGWPSLLLVLQEEGIYGNVCTRSMPHHAPNIHNYDNNTNEDNNSLGEGHHKFTTLLPETNLLGSFETGSEEVHGKLRDFIESHDGGGVEVGKPLVDCSIDENKASPNCSRNLNNENASPKDLLSGCDEQRVQMTLIYTFAAVAYGITAVFIGMSLEWLGLRTTRIIGTTFGCLGFIFLAYTTPEKSYFLWPALNLIALGTSQLRLSGFQFADLWPEYRATILTSYSSAYSISTTFFLIIQMLYEQRIPMRVMFLCCGGMCAATYIPSFLMPKMRIDSGDHRASSQGKKRSKCGEPLTEGSVSYAAQDGLKMNEHNGNENEELALPELNVENEDDNKNQVSTRPEKVTKGIAQFHKSTDLTTKARRGKYSFISSVLSLSGILHMYWHFINLFLVLFYSSTLNIWAEKVTTNRNNVSFYIKMSGVCCLIALLFVPVVGIVTDKMIRRAEKRPNRIERLAYTMQAPTFAMAGATFILFLTMICKLFLNETAIYISLILIALSRPAVVGSCTAYIRLRFPSEEFNILNGVFTTVISIICFVQYPILRWMTSSPESYYHAHWLLLLLLVGSLSSPMHMMIRKNIMRFAKIRLGESEE